MRECWPNDGKKRVRHENAADAKDQNTHAIGFPATELRAPRAAPAETRDQARQGKSVSNFASAWATAVLHRFGKIGTNENHCDQWTAITLSRVRLQACIASSITMARSRSVRTQNIGSRAMIL